MIGLLHESHSFCVNEHLLRVNMGLQTPLCEHTLISDCKTPCKFSFVNAHLLRVNMRLCTPLYKCAPATREIWTVLLNQSISVQMQSLPAATTEHGGENESLS